MSDDDLDVAGQLRQQLQEGGDWEPLYTPIRGVPVIKVPAAKTRPARLAVEVNLPSELGTTRKKRGLVLASDRMRQQFLAMLLHPDLPRLLNDINLANAPRGENAQCAGVRFSQPNAGFQWEPPPGKNCYRAPDAAPDGDFAVPECGTLSARASGVIRVSERAVLVSNAHGREIWIPKMALAEDCKSPRALQDGPWVFSVKGWFAKKQDFREWWVQNTQ